MDILGSIGKLYTFALLVLLFLGSGLAVWAGINAIINKKEKIKENRDKIMSNVSSSFNSMKNKNILGGINMKNNGFIKLAVFSLVGIIISAAILTALPGLTGGSMNNMNMASQYNAGMMNMQGTYDQSNMQGMSGYGMQGAMNTNPDLYYIQQQLNSMQQQINQLQNQMNSSSMNSMQSNSGNSMNNSGMSNSNSMNSNNMNNNSNSNSNSSMSSMPMM